MRLKEIWKPENHDDLRHSTREELRNVPLASDFRRASSFTEVALLQSLQDRNGFALERIVDGIERGKGGKVC